MCTILTFDYAFWQSNFSDVIDQLYADSDFNNDGICLVLDNTTVVHTMDIENIMTLLIDTKWKRAWVHFRLSTSNPTGVNYTHGFYTKDRKYLVMHNGIIPEGVGMPVDSMWIPELIDILGLEEALEHLALRQVFCNCFIIDMDNTSYYMTRGQSGTLYTDGKGNYSTNKLQSIDQEVPKVSFESHEVKIPKKDKKKGKAYSLNQYYDEMRDEYEYQMYGK